MPITIEPIDDMKEFCKARDTGNRVLISEELYWYFLEVLPPVWMHTTVRLPDGKDQFSDLGFAEGAERVTIFWSEGKGSEKRYLAQLTGIMNPYA